VAVSADFAAFKLSDWWKDVHVADAATKLGSDVYGLQAMGSSATKRARETVTK
jgi:hypothetical protein